MTFEVVPFTKEHYRPYSEWLEVRGRQVPKFEYLSVGRTVLADGKPVAAGFLFSCGNLCSAGNLASDPSGEGRSEAIDLLLEALLKLAKDGGHEMIAVNTNKKKLMDRLEKLGFISTDRELVQYLRAV